MNEAALLAARQGKREIDHIQLEEGIMRVIAGPEKKTRVMSEKERRITAFHEMGHAIVAHFLENTDPVHKISVISRGQALGYTISLPTEDKFLTTRAELQDTMAMTLGGRAAEELVFGEVTTGASNDIEKVTATAKQMVMRFGMSEKLGPRVFGHDHGQPFLGPRVLTPSPTTPTTSPARSTTRSAASSRRPTRWRATSSTSTRTSSTTPPRSSCAARRSSASEFIAAARRQDRARGLRPRRAGAAAGPAAARSPRCRSASPSASRSRCRGPGWPAGRRRLGGSRRPRSRTWRRRRSALPVALVPRSCLGRLSEVGAPSMCQAHNAPRDRRRRWRRCAAARKA